ncbi:MAG: carbohydrate ABC transporter permease [Acidimicrobiales bacterium]
MNTAEADNSSGLTVGNLGSAILYALIGAFLLWLTVAEPSKMLGTVWRVSLAVGLSAALFVAANKLFDQTRDRWKTFQAIVGGLVGAVVVGWLYGNRLLSALDLGRGPGGVTWVLLGALVVGGMFVFLSGVGSRYGRLAIGIAAGILAGGGLGLAIVESSWPAIDWPVAVVFTAVGGALFGLLGLWRGGPDVARRWGSVGLAAGWVIGAWGGAELGAGELYESVIAGAVAGGLFGLRLGQTQQLDSLERSRVESSSRKHIFLFPALLFIVVGLIIPLLRTVYLSLYDARTVEFVSLKNYGEIFTNDSSFDLSDWPNLFTSQLFWVGVFVVAAGVLAGAIINGRGGTGFELSSPSATAIASGALLISWAAFSVLRGTILNNLWWVVTVTVLASVFGLAIAELANRAKYENLAKSLIFLPMAISFVGAGIIWRFMYIARDKSKPQTGVMNSIWVWLGQVSNDDTQKAILAAFFVIVVALLMWLAIKGLRAKASGITVAASIAALPFALLLLKLLTSGLGGFTLAADGTVEPQTILFLTEAPFNNMWLMVVLIWIQVGFAMVIFSAAIKSVPGELVEAASIDGATEAQVFWKVTIPHIAPTIGVVVTTLIVLVMKVFDLVKVMTNGNFDTQVIANEMWQRAFTELNFGLGSALAIVLFLSVLPIMYFNIRKMQEDES